MDLSNIYNIETLIACVILAGMYLAVLIKCMEGSRFTFVLLVSGLMLVSNVFGVLVVISDFVIVKAYVPESSSYPSKVYVWIIIQGVGTIFRDSCFNTAHWEFAFKYLRIAHDVPMLLKGKNPEESRAIDVIYFTMHAVNILVAVLSGIDFILFNYAVFHD